MREILFRGKRLDTGEWVEGFYYANPAWERRLYGERHWIISDKNGISYEVDPATVGQYTGLLANGKRIFEGDIVRLHFIDAEEVGEIVWDEERCRVAYFSPDGDIYAVDGTVEIENIGNIHDNPELLEVTPDE